MAPRPVCIQAQPEVESKVASAKRARAAPARAKYRQKKPEREKGVTRVTEPRLMTGAEAAAYLGLTPTSFAKWVADGRAPKPLPGTRRWDCKAIDLALDKVSGIPPSPPSKEDQEEEECQRWIRDYEARKAARERG